MKILVTGGAGFIGSNLVDELIGEGHGVVVIDNLSTGKKENLNPKAKFYELDITDSKIETVFKAEKPEVVFHVAAQIDITKSTKDPVWDAEQNIIGSVNIFENSKNFKVKKVIFSSTAGVYGDNGEIPTTEDSAQLAPSPYGIGKLAAEKYLEYYRNTFGLDYVTLRYANVYGPRQISKGEGGVVAIFCDRLINKQPPIIHGDGEQTRDFVFVKDVVQANILAMESNKTGIYNISTSVETSINGLASLIKKELNYDLDFEYGSPRSVDQARSALDFTRARQELGFTPRVDLTSGIKETIEWFKN